MEQWKFDVDPNDPLVALRIPVTSMYPTWGYFAAFDKESQRRPSEVEARMIFSFIEESVQAWGVPITNAGLDGEPFDWFPGYNTVVLHKYAEDDWGYRRRTWPCPEVYPPPPEDRFERTFPHRLESIFDLIHTGVRSERISDDWLLWKKDHPEVFGS